jgi:hypothetical protein
VKSEEGRGKREEGRMAERRRKATKEGERQMPFD